MRFSRSLAVVACVMFGAAAFYVSYEAGSASMGAESSPRLEGLGDLLNPQDAVSMQEMDPVMLDAFMDTAMQHPAWLEAQDMFAQKGLLPDWGTAQGFVATVDGVPVQIFTIETTAQDGTYGVYVFAKDDKGTEQVWKMLTNIGTKSVVGADPLISDLPVYVWSNGMPVYYVYVWHYFNFRWYPYYYLWHDSHNHPNWYYSYYNYWWWWHRWYDYPWAPWFNWFYAWWYWRYFYYWSTWFPY